MCDFWCNRSYFKWKNSIEKQRKNQWIQDNIKAQQTLPKFHLRVISELLFFIRKYKLLHLTEQVHLIWSSPTSASASPDVPQCSSFDRPSSPRCWSSFSSQDEVLWIFLIISTKDCLIWSAAFRKRSCSRSHCKNVWPRFAAGSFPTSLSPWLGFKGHYTALPFDIPCQPHHLACDRSVFLSNIFQFMPYI